MACTLQSLCSLELWSFRQRKNSGNHPGCVMLVGKVCVDVIGLKRTEWEDEADHKEYNLHISVAG
jgi:hypothetical protein